MLPRKRRGWRRSLRARKPTSPASMPSWAMQISFAVRPKKSWKVSGKSAKRLMLGAARSSRRWSGLPGCHDVLLKVARRIGLWLVYLTGLALCLLLALAVVTTRSGDHNLWPAPRDARTIEVFVVN